LDLSSEERFSRSTVKSSRGIQCAQGHHRFDARLAAIGADKNSAECSIGR